MLYHLVSQREFEGQSSSAPYMPASLAGEGFIHLTAEPERVAWVANAFYREVPDLLVLSVDETRLAAPVRFERTPDGVFPHLYGPLERRAIVAIQPMPRNQTGDYEFPGA